MLFARTLAMVWQNRNLLLSVRGSMLVVVIVEVVMVMIVAASPQQVHGEYDKSQQYTYPRHRHGYVRGVDDFCGRRLADVGRIGAVGVCGL